MNPYDSMKGNCNRDVLWPSDNLRFLREFVYCLPQLTPIIGELPQVRIVIDANVALAELIYRLKNRRDPEARTGLHEVIAAGTVIAYAPFALVREVETRIPQIAALKRIPQYRLHEEWIKFRTLLHFYEPEAPVAPLGPEVADPKDLPYRDLWAEIGARGVYSKDAHLPRMGAPLITVDVVIALRDYSRAASVDVGIKIGGVVAIAVGVEFLRAIVAFSVAAGRGFYRLPTAVKVLIVALLTIAVAHPTSRKMIRTRLSAVLKELGEIALPLLTKASTSLSIAQRDKALRWETANTNLPAGKRQTAKTHLRAVCAAAKKPLNLFELERRVLAAGYVSRAKDFRAYLKRILHEDSRFVQVQPGCWVISRF